MTQLDQVVSLVTLAVILLSISHLHYNARSNDRRKCKKAYSGLNKRKADRRRS